MKKIIFLLLLTVAGYGQQTNFPYGIKNPAATSDNTPAYFTTTQVDGVHKKTPAALVAKTATVNDSLATKENVANKSDSYTSSSSTTYASTKALVDGLDLKAVDANVLHKTGEETIGLGEKYFTDNVNFTYIAVSGQAIGRAAVSPNEFVIKSQLDLKAPLSSPTFTGTPTAPTAASGTNTTQIATTAFVQGEKAITVRKISTNTTLADSDNGTIILLTASCTVTLPNGLMSGFNCSFSTLAGATLTYSLGGSVVLLNNLGTTMAEKLSHTIVNTGVSNEYLTAGSL